MICCLCFCECSDFQHLFDGSGRSSEVFEVAVRYFDKELKDVSNTENSPATNGLKFPSVLCGDCWRHINEFNCFREKIQIAQTQYERLLQIEQVECIVEETHSSSTEKSGRKLRNHDKNVALDPVDIKTTTTTKNHREVKKVKLKINLKSTGNKAIKQSKREKFEGSSVQKLTAKRGRKPKEIKAKDLALRSRKKVLSNELEKGSSDIVNSEQCVSNPKVPTLKVEPLCVQVDGSIEPISVEAISVDVDECKPANFKTEPNSDVEDVSTTNLKSKTNSNLNKASIVEDIPDIKSDSSDKSEDFVSDSETNLNDSKNAAQAHNIDIPAKRRTKRGRKSKPDLLSKAERKKSEKHDQFLAEHGKHELLCDVCNHSCDNFSALRVHFREEHNIGKAYVVCCGYKYYFRSHLVEHLNFHIDPNYFKCEKCGKCCHNRRSLANHIKTRHPDQPLERRFECEVCKKRFAKLTILRGHMDIHAAGNKDHVCSHCGKGFVLESRLNIHVRNVHSNDYSSICDICGKSLRGRYAIKAHLLMHQGIKKEKWPCDKCDAKLYSKFSLRRHQLAHHDGSTVFVCSECGKIALTEDALRSHKKYVHQTERKYKCTICDKAFKVAIVLREHMTTHTGEDLYQCPHCPKKFKVSANMHHHRKRIHPKEWLENSQNRKLASHANLKKVSNEIVL